MPCLRKEIEWLHARNFVACIDDALRITSLSCRVTRHVDTPLGPKTVQLF